MANTASVDWPERWAHISKLLERGSKMAHPDFEPGPDNLKGVNQCKILVVGAGGLGCELLKDLALSGFQNIHVIDMDTIDLSNLNRQFLFRLKDVGSFKAEVAARIVSQRVPGCNVVAHNCKIQDKNDDFYRSFNLIVCGLDSIVARRWLNGMIVGLLNYDDEGNLNPGTIIPIIDGGTEGFKGNARVILPGYSPCIECTINLYPPQVNFPLCTIAHTPRLPEHCVEYVKVIQWEKDAPFKGAALDGDDPSHVEWVFDEATKRAEQYSINGVTYRLTQGVLKRIIPAVASTNAVIAAACAFEAFKLASNIALPLNNYVNFSDVEGIFMGAVSMEKRDDCLVCSRVPQKLTFAEDSKLQQVIDYLTTSPDFQMKSPSVTAPGKTLYMASAVIPALEELSRKNLRLSLKELGLADGHEIAVADETLSQPLTFRLQLTAPAMDVTQ